MTSVMSINGRKIVHCATLLVPKGEMARLEFQIDDWQVLLNIAFEDKPELEREPAESNAPSAGLVMNGQEGTLTFRNWGRPFGVSIGEPWRIGTTANNVVGLLAIIAFIGGIYRAELQFMTYPQVQS